MAEDVPTLRRYMGLGSRQLMNLELPTYFVKARVIECLQELFSHRKDDYKWRADEEDTGILITDVYALDLKTVEKKPGVIIRRGSTTWEHAFINQMLEGHGHTGAKIGSDHRISGVTLYCTGRGGLEAEFVADVVDSGFAVFRDIIRGRAKGIIDVRMRGIGQETLVRSDSTVELSVVPVTMELHVQQKWMAYPLGAKRFQGMRVRSE